MSEHELWNELGKIYFSMGAYDAAINAYTRAIELNPRFELSYSNLALTYAQKGQFPEALLLYRKCINLSQSNQAKAIAWNRLGDIYRQLKDYDNAVAAFRKADELDLDIAMFEEPQAALEEEPGFMKEDLATQEKHAVPGEDFKPESVVGSLPQASQAGELHSFTGNPGAETQPDLAQAVDHPQAGLDQAAVPATISEVANAIDDDLTSILIEEQSMALQGPPQEQQEQSETVASSVDSQPDSLEAEPVDDVPDDDDRNVTSTSVPMEAQLLKPADLPDFSDAEQEPGMDDILPDDLLAADPVALMADGFTPLPAVDNRDTDEAEEPQSFVSALEQDKLAELNRDIINMKRVLEINSESAFGWDSLGNLYKSIGQYDEAIAAYDRAIQLDPYKAFYYYNLGQAYAAKKEYDQAIRVFQKVLELNPGYYLAHASIAGCYRHLGQEEEAQQYIKVAVASFQHENEYNLACFEAICGNIDHSIELLRESLARNQVSLEWVRHDPDLEFVRRDPRYEALVGIR